jgi:hypothetical protein
MPTGAARGLSVSLWLAAIALIVDTGACGGNVIVDAGNQGGASHAATQSQSQSAASTSASTGSGGRVPLHHRPDDAQCFQPAAPGNCNCGGNCSNPPFMCANDAQCADAGPNGRCFNPGGPAGCWCTYDACAGDVGCPSGETCACHGSPFRYGAGNQCVPGNCRVDADCGVSGYCSPSPDSQCGDAGDLCLGYYCHTSHDQCVDDSDCTEPANTCVYSVMLGYWQCQSYEPPV